MRGAFSKSVNEPINIYWLSFFSHSNSVVETRLADISFPLRLSFKISYLLLDMVVYSFNLSIWEAGALRSLWVWSYPGLKSEFPGQPKWDSSSKKPNISYPQLKWAEKHLLHRVRAISCEGEEFILDNILSCSPRTKRILWKILMLTDMNLDLAF